MNAIPLIIAICLDVSIVGTVSYTQCPDNWIAFMGSCYHFRHDPIQSFLEALHYCRELHGAHMLHMNNAAETAFIKETLRYICPKTAWWLGLTDESVEGVWKWTDTDEVVKYTNWNPNEPNDFHGGEDCADITPNTVHWNDIPCDMTKLYNISVICELEYGGSSYYCIYNLIENVYCSTFGTPRPFSIENNLGCLCQICTS